MNYFSLSEQKKVSFIYQKDKNKRQQKGQNSVVFLFIQIDNTVCYFPTKF